MDAIEEIIQDRSPQACQGEDVMFSRAFSGSGNRSPDWGPSLPFGRVRD